MKQLHRFDLNLLKSLDALLTEKNVTKAAERVYLSQPAMSGSLKRLREELDDQLLVRTGHEMVLTPLAETLVVPVREVLQSVQDLLSTGLNFDPANARRSMKISATDYASMVLMPHVLKYLSENAPHIRCDIQPVSGNLAAELMGGDIDIFIGSGRWLQDHAGRYADELHSEPMFSDDFVCVLSEDHPTVGSELNLERYQELPHALLRFPRQVDTLIEAQWRARGLDLQIGVTAPNFSTLVLMLPQTRLIATVPRRLAKVFCQALPLKLVESPIQIPAVEEVLIWHTRAAGDPAHDYLRSIMFASANKV